MAYGVRFCQCLCGLGVRRRGRGSKSARTFAALALLLAGLGGASLGCNNENGLSPYGTPLGVATLKIVASAYVDNTVASQSVYLTVNVLAPGETP